MIFCHRFTFFCALALGLVIATGEVDTRGAKIDLQLVSEVKSIRSGEPFHVALHITHQPGWHTYWRQPGIVGVPTSLKWDLPEGFSAGEIQWPNPDRVKMAIYTAYGFKRDVLLIVKIEPPGDLEAGKRVELRASGAWMACSKTCHPGWGEFELSLPVSEVEEPEFDPTWRSKFEILRDRRPAILKGWDLTAIRKSEKELELKLTPEGEANLPSDAEIYFFSHDNQVHSNEPQVLQRSDDRKTLLLTMVRGRFGPQNPKNLAGLLFNSAGWTQNGGAKFARIAASWKDSGE